MRRAVHAIKTTVRSIGTYYLQRRGLLETALSSPELVVATKAGLYAVQNRVAVRLLGGNFYGLTRDGDALLAFQAFSHIRRGRVLRLQGGAWSTLVSGLPWGCHQIDLIDGQLFVTDTHSNAVRVYGRDGTHRRTVFPRGQLASGRRSSNYAHMNSIWSDGEDIYILCHNETAKTGRLSEVLVCDADLKSKGSRATQAQSAHNFLLWRDAFLTCDSLGGRLLHGERELCRLPGFLRGLAVTPQALVVGRSSYARRGERAHAPGGLTAMDHRGAILWQLDLPGQVQEVRGWRLPDLGLSAAAARPLPERRNQTGGACVSPG